MGWQSEKGDGGADPQQHVQEGFEIDIEELCTKVP